MSAADQSAPPGAVRRRGSGRKPSQARRAAELGMPLRSFHRRARAIERLAWWPAGQRAVLTAAAAGRLPYGAPLEQLTRAPHWVARLLIALHKLGDASAKAPIKRGVLATQIANLTQKYAAGDPSVRRLAAPPCPCGVPTCGAESAPPTSEEEP